MRRCLLQSAEGLDNNTLSKPMEELLDLFGFPNLVFMNKCDLWLEYRDKSGLMGFLKGLLGVPRILVHFVGNSPEAATSDLS